MLQCKRSMQKVVVDFGQAAERDVRSLVLDNDGFWMSVQSSFDCLLPLAKSITALESDSSVLSDVPEFFRLLRNAATTLLQNSILSRVSHIRLFI